MAERGRRIQPLGPEGMGVADGGGCVFRDWTIIKREVSIEKSEEKSEVNIQMRAGKSCFGEVVEA